MSSVSDMSSGINSTLASANGLGHFVDPIRPINIPNRNVILRLWPWWLTNGGWRRTSNSIGRRIDVNTSCNALLSAAYQTSTLPLLLENTNDAQPMFIATF